MQTTPFSQSVAASLPTMRPRHLRSRAAAAFVVLAGLTSMTTSQQSRCQIVPTLASSSDTDTDSPDTGSDHAAENSASPAAIASSDDRLVADASGFPAMLSVADPMSRSADGALFVNPPYQPVPLQDCPFDHTGARECRIHWHQLIISAALFNAFENSGNLYTGYWYRYETTTGKWWDRYVNSVEGWRWDRWADNNPFLDDYIGHPMMGAITNAIWKQDDPKSMTLEQSNTWPYWRSLLRQTGFSTFYSFEWKLGPLGEAAIGHNGDHYFGDQGTITNETGWVELVTTPVGGTLWTMAEDALDKHLIRHLEDKSRNPFALLSYQFLNPARGTANILRFRPPWYRDSRVVKANSFWSDPPGPETISPMVAAAASGHAPPVGQNTARDAAEGEAAGSALSEARAELPDPPAPSPSVQRGNEPPLQPVWPRPGGEHEFGAWWGLSLMSGHIWGYAKDVKYMPIDVRYSYLFSLHDHWAMRYSPELTALAMLDEPISGQKSALLQRQRSYGSGVSPVGFQSDFFPSSRVQPFLSTNGGFIYFDQRVLSPEGSQWMYTIDFGGGVNIFRKERQAVTIGYRYQHLSNANISEHNPGTDTNVFYVSVSRFRTKGYR
jgi:hypothetical protein